MPMLGYLRILLATRVANQRGASAVEYGLLCAAVILACALSLEVLGDGVQAVFNKQQQNFSECYEDCSTPAP